MAEEPLNLLLRREPWHVLMATLVRAVSGVGDCQGEWFLFAAQNKGFSLPAS